MPLGTTVQVNAKPRTDASVVSGTTGGLAGSPAKATVNLALPAGGVYLEAFATFQFP